MTLHRVILTRPREHAERLAARLPALGIDPVVVPAVAFEPPASFGELDDAIRHLDRYAWVLFTSRTGVRVFFGRVSAVRPVALPPSVRWAAVGPGTAEALHVSGIAAVWTPSRYLSEAAGAELPAEPGDHVLRIRAEAASPIPAVRLRARGALVDEVVAYRTIEGPPESIPILVRALAGGVDGVIFTSASTVRGFAGLVRAAGVQREIQSLVFIAIGPVTAEALRAQGWPVHLTADEHSLEGLVASLARRRQIDASNVTRR